MNGYRIAGLQGTVFSHLIGFFEQLPEVSHYFIQRRKQKKRKTDDWSDWRIVYYNFKENFKFIILLSRIEVHRSLFERNEKA